MVDTFEELSSGAQKELEKQEVLLSGVDADLEIISRMRIHAEFMSPAVRKAMEAGERARTLGDYVSNMKMRQVAETCAKSHEDLRLRFLQVQDKVSRLNQGADDVRANVSNTLYVFLF
jgi:autophagy-related protein 11